MPVVDMFADETGGPAVALSPKEKQRAQMLERVLTVLAALHGDGLPTVHPDTNEIVSDLEFDKMYAELEDLDPAAIKRIGNASASPIDPNAKKMKHDPPMVSIKKANGTIKERTEAFEKWVKLVGDELKLTRDQVLAMLTTSFKHDGVAVSLKYVNGDLAQAGLRPRDGTWGEDVTANVKYVYGIPSKLPLPISCTIRGELECRISTFNKLNGTPAVESQEFANPRNYTTGSIRQHKDPTKTKSRQLTFVGYSILNFGDSHKYYKTEIERAKWANKTLGVNFVRTEPWTKDTFEKLELMIPELDYEVDGVVVSINDLESQEQLGTYGGGADGNPRGKLAWKFADDTADPKAEDIIYETGRTGDITPVIHFKGVKLAGTTVVKASAHSVGFLIRNNIHKGTQIKIRKSGKIIPEVMGYWDGLKYIEKVEAGDPSLPPVFDANKFDYPHACPSCGKPTTLEPGGTHGMFSLVCKNSAECPAQNIKTFENYLEKFGVKGIGESTVEALVTNALIKSFPDFYTLTVTNLRNAGWSIREALLDVARIHMVSEPEKEKDNTVLAKRTVDAIKRKKHIPLAKFIACLGIPGAGKGTGSALTTHFLDLTKILDASEAELAAVADIGAKTAGVLRKYFTENRAVIDTLANDHLEIELPKQGRFTGKSFVFTGGQPEGKEYWKDAVESEGGTVKGSVSKDIDYVIVGVDAGAKYDKAVEMKAQGHKLIIVESHDELVKMFA